jgi:hypothetical protein
MSEPVLWIRITLMRIPIQLFTLMRMRIRIYLSDADPDPDFSPWCFKKKAQTLERVLKKAHIPYILA